MINKTGQKIEKLNNLRYSIWTLRPKDPLERQLFFEFRINDVIEQYGYFIVAVAFFTIMPLLSLIKNKDKQHFILFMDGLIAITFAMLLWLARGRLKNKFGWGITIFYMISVIMRVVSTKLQMMEEDNAVDQVVILNRNIEILREKAILFSIFFCPSFIYFFALILSSSAGIIALIMIFPDSENAAG